MDARLKVTNHPLPLSYLEQITFDAIITVVAAIFVLIPYTFFPANCVAFLVKEREVKAKHLQLLSGLKPSAYWLAAYIFDNACMAITTICTLSLFAVFGLPPFAPFLCFSPPFSFVLSLPNPPEPLWQLAYYHVAKQSPVHYHTAANRITVSTQGSSSSALPPPGPHQVGHFSTCTSRTASIFVSLWAFMGKHL